ncbi:MAG TPA: DUF3017 domain-containing protein [Marmoricola sp.]|nr:DUF3017 domain-containing protein [Marmoricola sp.]
MTPRQRPQTFGGVVYLLVVAATVCGIGLVALDSWRRGVALVGVALIIASGIRLVLGEDEAGMLRVRSRWFDAASLVAVGIALIVLSANIPAQARI